MMNIFGQNKFQLFHISCILSGKELLNWILGLILDIGEYWVKYWEKSNTYPIPEPNIKSIPNTSFEHL